MQVRNDRSYSGHLKDKRYMIGLKLGARLVRYGLVLALLSGNFGFSALVIDPRKDGADPSYSLSISGRLRTDLIGGNQTMKNQFFFDKSDVLAIVSGNNPGTHLKNQASSINVKGEDSMLAVDGTRLSIIVERTQPGIGKISFNLVLTGDANSSQSVKEMYGKFELGLGSLFLGDTVGAEQRMIFAPSDFIPGTGGTDGNFSRWLNQTTYVFMAPSVVGDAGVATKVFVASNRVGGLQLGFSYTPHTEHLGEGNLSTAESGLETPLRTFDLNSVVPAINYIYEKGLFVAKLSAAYLHGKTKPEIPNEPLLDRVNTNSWDFGCVLQLGPLSLGAEYLANGNGGILRKNIASIEPTIGTTPLPAKSYLASAAGKYWALNTGVAYTSGDVSFGVSYFYTRRNTGIVPLFSSGMPMASSVATGSALVFSSEYRLAAGLSMYVEFGKFNMKNPDWAYIGAGFSALTGIPYNAVPPNKSFSYIAGITIQF